MASNQTEDEVRADYITTMGAELGELQFLLWHDVTWLHLKWAQYVELFATKSSRIDLMNETAPAFFGGLQDVLWDDVLLHLSRLTDPPATGGQQNLTFRRLPRVVANMPIRDEVHTALNRVDAATRFAREWRDKRLAHRAWDHARDPKARPLSGGSRAQVKAALEAIRELMQIPESHFRDTTVAYDMVIESPGGVWNLLYHLDSGLESVRAREAERVHWWPKYL